MKMRVGMRRLGRRLDEEHAAGLHAAAGPHLRLQHHRPLIPSMICAASSGVCATRDPVGSGMACLPKSRFDSNSLDASTDRGAD